MIQKIILILLLFFIIFSLGSAFKYLLKPQSANNKMVKALTWRICLSMICFALIMTMFALGWLAPNQII